MSDRVTLPPFELATFDVSDVEEGSSTRWEAGRLDVDVAALVSSAADPALAEVHLDVVRPGDAVRVANVLDAVLPDVKAGEPERTFPGALGTLAQSGHGRTNRVGGLSVLSVCDWLAAGYTTEDELPGLTGGHGRTGRRAHPLGIDDERRGAMRACRRSAGRRRGSSRQARIAADRARHRGDDDRPGARLRWKRSPHPPAMSIPTCRPYAASCRSRRRGR